MKRRIPQDVNDYRSEQDYSNQTLINIDYCFRTACGVPQTYKGAVNSPKAKCCIEASKK